MKLISIVLSITKDWKDCNDVTSVIFGKKRTVISKRTQIKSKSKVSSNSSRGPYFIMF